MFGKPPSYRHLLLWRRRGRIGIALLAGALAVGSIVAVAVWVPKEQAQLILPAFSTLVAAAITGWLSSRRPRR